MIWSRWTTKQLGATNNNIPYFQDGPDPDEVPTAEERGFWKAVEENPGDFASWTYLLQVVEKNGKLKQTKKAFSQFLSLYPYCYGYWKKYADQLKKLVSHEAANEVKGCFYNFLVGHKFITFLSIDHKILQIGFC